ncbi:MAG: 5'/3'-nucleotidase SurE [Muribaculaceae bacterium]|nr:5'/3'-nucleotidase SurE [Muribaculaceae bacterium]
MNRRPLILVSNDDGYRARGVHHLTRLLQEFGDVVAVCPEGPQSGKSMAITVYEPLRITPVDDYCEDEPDVEWYHVNGTPTDCVKIAMHTVLRDRRPDLVCTGINHGSNASVNVLYSGTMGAAFEGCVFGIPSIGFSLCDHSPEADFLPMLPYVRRIVEDVMEKGLPEGVCLNVNAPKCSDLAGMRHTVACKGHWSDEYAEYTDPHGHPYYWMTGRFINEEPDNPDTDDALLARGFVTIVPCQIDRTSK